MTRTHSSRATPARIWAYALIAILVVILTLRFARNAASEASEAGPRDTADSTGQDNRPMER